MVLGLLGGDGVCFKAELALSAQTASLRRSDSKHKFYEESIKYICLPQIALQCFRSPFPENTGRQHKYLILRSASNPFPRMLEDLAVTVAGSVMAQRLVRKHAVTAASNSFCTALLFAL